MNERMTAKLAIAAVGLAVFLTGARLELPPVRWIGIALVAVAFLLRFIGPRARDTAPKSGP